MADATVTELLSGSRRAHKEGRALMGAKQYLRARVAFQNALDWRLQARTLDPKRADDAWAGDLVGHSGARWLKQGRSPEASESDILERFDLELERYFRQQLGDDQNTSFQADLKTPGTVVAPNQWVTFSDGVTPCANCSHPEHDGEACTLSVFVDTDISACLCKDYAPASCRHQFVPDTTTQRTCRACGEVQRLTPTMDVKETLAFQQLQRERKRS